MFYNETGLDSLQQSHGAVIHTVSKQLSNFMK